MKRKDLARPRLGIASIGEPGNDPRAFINEGKWLLVLYPLELRAGIAGGLFLNRRDLVAPIFRLGFDDPNGLAIDEQGVVCWTDIGLEFPDRDAWPDVKVDVLVTLNFPARFNQHGVDFVASLLFRILVRLCHPCNMQ